MQPSHFVHCTLCGYLLPFVNGRVIFGHWSYTMAEFHKLHYCQDIRGGKAWGHGLFEVVTLERAMVLAVPRERG